MNEWHNFENEKPDLEFGEAYEFFTEIDTTFGKNQSIIPVIWNGNDWYLIPFESISGYEGISGKKYFEVYIPKYWRVYQAPNVVY